MGFSHCRHSCDKRTKDEAYKKEKEKLFKIEQQRKITGDPIKENRDNINKILTTEINKKKLFFKTVLQSPLAESDQITSKKKRKKRRFIASERNSTP